MRIAVNKKIIKGPWGGGNQILKMLVAYFQGKGIEVVYSLKKGADAVLMMDVRDRCCTFPLSEISKHDVRVVHRINDTGAHRANDKKRTELILRANEIADGTVFISDWVQDFYKKNGFSKSSCFIDNACDRKLFFPSKRVRKEKEPLRIVTHHWSDNVSKGYDFYKKVSEFCDKNPEIAQFRFVGRSKCFSYFAESSQRIKEKPYEEIPRFLNDQDLYISASLFEAGGCHIVEGMSCGTIPIARKGGGGTESYSKGYGFVFETEDDIFDIINTLYNKYDLYRQMKDKVEKEYTYSAEEMGKKYLDVLRGVE